MPRNKAETEKIVGGVAHNFGNLFTIILGHAELAVDNLSQEGLHGHNLEEIRKAVLRGRDVIRQLRSYVRPDNEHLHEVCHLAQLVRETGEVMRTVSLLSVEISSHVDETSDLVRGDATQLREMLTNLYINAAEAMEERGGELRVELGNETHFSRNLLKGYRQKKYLALRISDTGCGMSKETQKMVFDPFFTTKRGERIGMGLAIVRAVVERHSGTVCVRSKLGKGTSFTIALPRITTGPNG